MDATQIHHRLTRDHDLLLERSLITEGLIFPLMHARFLDYCQWLEYDRDKLAELAAGRLAEQLLHAIARVPAHRRTGASASLTDWPFMSKTDIRANLADYCDDDISPASCRVAYTSGTTGIPVKLVHDFEHIAHAHALALRRNQVDGLPLRRRILMPLRDGAIPWTEYASPARGNSIVAQFGSAGRHISRDLVRRAAEFEPDVVYGHPSNCVALAEAATSNSARIRPRMTLCYGEALSADQRTVLEAAFDAPVRDAYGMREFGTIAVQCALGRYHIEGERLIVEVVDTDGAQSALGQPGEVVITDLVNRAMPLIRYRTGDTATIAREPCGCGRQGDLLTGIEGRGVAMIAIDDGPTVPVDGVARVVRRYPLRRFQIVRRAQRELEILVVPSGRWPLAASTKLSADVEAYLDGAASVAVRTVEPDEFHRSGSGKDCDYISMI